MSMIIKHIDEMVKECGHYYYADVNVNINNGYNCNHQNQEECEMVEGIKIGKCYCWSCPLAFEADEEDFENPDINKNGWTEFEEMSFLVVETIED